MLQTLKLDIQWVPLFFFLFFHFYSRQMVCLVGLIPCFLKNQITHERIALKLCEASGKCAIQIEYKKETKWTTQILGWLVCNIVAQGDKLYNFILLLHTIKKMWYWWLYKDFLYSACIFNPDTADPSGCNSHSATSFSLQITDRSYSPPLAPRNLSLCYLPTKIKSKSYLPWKICSPTFTMPPPNRRKEKKNNSSFQPSL